MEIRHLRYFLAVARQNSIAQAARHLNIVQPALSRQIQDLEQELGVTLFERSVKGIALTNGGRQFLKDAEKIVDDLEIAKKRVLHAATANIESLRIGISPTHTWHPVFLARLRRFRESFPHINLKLEPALSARQIKDIKDGRMDGGFFALRDPNDAQLSGTTILSSGLLLALPIDSKYALQPPLQLKELAHEPCVWFTRSGSPVYHDYLIRQCQLAGLSPKIALVCEDVATALGMVAAGMGYSIISESSQYNCPADVVLHKHANLHVRHEVELVFLEDNMNPALSMFAEVLCPQELAVL